jgi:hypothetical protein
MQTNTPMDDPIDPVGARSSMALLETAGFSNADHSRPSRGIAKIHVIVLPVVFEAVRIASTTRS